jgi:glycosyltransferase involved in cell wall biosynthesis
VSRINVLWAIDHVCYDGALHGGGRLYWNVVPRFDARSFRIIPCFLRASQTVRRLFADGPVPVRILDKGKYDLSTLGTFIRLIKRERIDVLHLHCYAASSFGRLAWWITGVPAIVCDYDTEVYFPYPRYLGLLDHILARRTDGAVAASPMVRDFMMVARKIPPEKIRLMFHAVPPEKYRPVPPERIMAVRRRLGAGEQTKIVGTVTKLGPQRGNAYLLKAAGQVLRRFSDVHFMIVYKKTVFHRAPSEEYVSGRQLVDEGETLPGLQILTSQLGLENKITFIDSRDQLDDLVASTDLMVFPFLSKRFSSVNLLEAMAQGKPVIATDMGEQREIVRNDRNGYLVTPGDEGQLAAKILSLLQSPDELGSMGHTARVFSEQYSVDTYVRRLQEWYTELATGGRFGHDGEGKKSP